MIRVRLGEIYHYGIFVSEDEVIQFGPPPLNRPILKDSEIEVISTDIDVFLSGNFLEVAELDKKERKKSRGAQKTVAYAKSKIGTRGYNILYNNCEHFANECVFGVASCSQADRVRAMFRSMPLVDVYTSEIPDGVKIEGVFPTERDEEIKSVRNERVKREKYYVWQLLEYALDRSLGLKMKKMTFSKTDTGKWITKDCFFSLSHSGNAVAVAISRAPVGIDIESPRSDMSEGLAKKILNETETCELSKLPEEERASFVIKKWCAKEAIFKRSDAPLFEPSKIAAKDCELFSKLITIGKESFVCAVSTSIPEKIRFYENIKI